MWRTVGRGGSYYTLPEACAPGRCGQRADEHTLPARRHAEPREPPGAWNAAEGFLQEIAHRHGSRRGRHRGANQCAAVKTG